MHQKVDTRDDFVFGSKCSWILLALLCFALLIRVEGGASSNSLLLFYPRREQFIP